MSKIKLSAICDAAAPTGFATVTHNVMGYLQETGEYDINILGINFDGKPNEWSKKFNIWPARIGGDFLGVGATADFIKQTSPDVTFLFQDFFNLPLYISELPPLHPGVVAYYPVDAPNIKGTFLLAMGCTVAVACYTDFAVAESVRGTKEGWKKLLSDAKQANVQTLGTFNLQAGGGTDPITGQVVGGREFLVSASRIHALTRPENYNVIPHGIDLKSFHALDRTKCRKFFDLPIDAFIVGNVNRNQPRKRIDLSIRAFSKFAKGKSNVYLLLHSVRNDPSGWDIAQLSRYYDVADKVIPSHKFFEDKTATVSELNRLYNALDVQINTGGGEGWGLTSFEGAASRIPQLVPEWSATKEIWADAGELIKVAAVSHNVSSINLMHCVIDCDDLAEKLNNLYEDKTYREQVGDKCYEVTQREEYKWENVGKQFDTLFKESAGKAVPEGTIALTMEGALQLKNTFSPSKKKNKPKAKKKRKARR